MLSERPTRDASYENAEHGERVVVDRKSTRLNSSHGYISYAVFCLKKKTTPSPVQSALQGAAARGRPDCRRPAAAAGPSPWVLKPGHTWIFGELPRLPQEAHRHYRV